MDIKPVDYVEGTEYFGSTTRRMRGWVNKVEVRAGGKYV